jgi:hypothetical protein
LRTIGTFLAEFLKTPPGELDGRVRLTNSDRWFFIQLYRWFPAIPKVFRIIRPETLVRALAQSRLSWLLALEVSPGKGDRRSTPSCAS